MTSKVGSMKPGIYRLIRDVANPHPDRRKRHDWRALSVWPAGMELFCWERDTQGATVPVLTAGRVSHDASEATMGKTAWEALTSALAPTPCGVAAMLALGRVRGHRNAEGALEALIEDGVITLAQLQAALEKPYPEGGAA